MNDKWIQESDVLFTKSFAWAVFIKHFVCSLYFHTWLAMTSKFESALFLFQRHHIKLCKAIISSPQGQKWLELCVVNSSLSFWNGLNNLCLKCDWPLRSAVWISYHVKDLKDTGNGFVRITSGHEQHMSYMVVLMNFLQELKAWTLKFCNLQLLLVLRYAVLKETKKQADLLLIKATLQMIVSVSFLKVIFQQLVLKKRCVCCATFLLRRR